MQKALGSLMIAVLLLVPAACATRPKTIWVKPDITEAGVLADSKTCFAEGEAAERGNSRVVDPISKGIGDVNAFLAAHRRCGARLGYTEVTLTKEQAAELKTKKTRAEVTAYAKQLALQLEATKAVTTEAADPSSPPQ